MSMLWPLDEPLVELSAPAEVESFADAERGEPIEPVEPVEPADAAERPEPLASARPATAVRPATPVRAAAPVRRPAAAARSLGLTARGAATVMLVTTLLAGGADLVISGHRGHLFGLGFVFSAALAASGVRRRDLWAAAIAAPFVYCMAIGLISLVDNATGGGFATREALYLGNAFVTGTPAMWAGTAIAVAVGVQRRRRS
jgi:hypothetical protein